MPRQFTQNQIGRPNRSDRSEAVTGQRQLTGLNRNPVQHQIHSQYQAKSTTAARMSKGPYQRESASKNQSNSLAPPMRRSNKFGGEVVHDVE